MHGKRGSWKNPCPADARQGSGSGTEPGAEPADEECPARGRAWSPSAEVDVARGRGECSLDAAVEATEDAVIAEPGSLAMRAGRAVADNATRRAVVGLLELLARDLRHGESAVYVHGTRGAERSDDVGLGTALAVEGNHGLSPLSRAVGLGRPDAGIGAEEADHGHDPEAKDSGIPLPGESRQGRGVSRSSQGAQRALREPDA